MGAVGQLWADGTHGQTAFRALSDKVAVFLALSNKGAEFLFENLARPEYFFTDGSTWPGFGFQFAFTVLPTIIFFSAFMSVMYYLGIIQVLIQAMARFMHWSLGTSGSETMSCSSNVFVGQTEAPFLIKPFIDDMTPSELHAVMVGGFATIAGGVLAGYIQMGVNPGHLIAASVMSAPAALVIAKLLFPETEESVTAGDVEIPEVKTADNIVEAAANGTTDGLKLALNVGAMLIAFISLIAFLDLVLGYFDVLVDHRLLGGEKLADAAEYPGIFPGSMKTLFGTLLAPLAFVMGVPWADAAAVGNLLGTKLTLNEFVAYGFLAEHVSAGDLQQRSLVIATYALCGFANFSSIGIQIGGIGSLAPNRRALLSKIALRALMGGALASFTTATVAGMLL
ncbi:MAG: nucleoside transporter C-terminal domain-containing protein [Acidobacteriota bacterium]